MRLGVERVTAAIRATATDPVRRWDTAWTAIGVLVAAVAIWQGSGYAVGGAHVTQSSGWTVLTRALPGGMHTHGAIMVFLGAWLLLQLRGEYTIWTVWCLRVLRTYCILVAVSWFASWLQYGISWGAPGWWVLLAGLTVWMTFFSPGVDSRA